MAIGDPIPNTAYPTAGQGLVLDLNGQLPLAVQRTLPGYEYPGSYVEQLSNVSITQTTEAAADTIVTAGAVIFDGATTVYVSVVIPYIVAPAVSVGRCRVYLYEAVGGAAAASIGQLTQINNQGSATGLVLPVAMLPRRLTPSAGPHTYSVRAAVPDGGTATAGAGPGGSGQVMPIYIKVTRA